MHSDVNRKCTPDVNYFEAVRIEVCDSLTFGPSPAQKKTPPERGWCNMLQRDLVRPMQSVDANEHCDQLLSFIGCLIVRIGNIDLQALSGFAKPVSRNGLSDLANPKIAEQPPKAARSHAAIGLTA